MSAPLEVPGWHKYARCLGEDPELWFPTPGVSSVRKNLERAVAICHQCPVRLQCLEWALDIEDRPNVIGSHGVFGGLLATERDEIRAERAKARRERGEPEPEPVPYVSARGDFDAQPVAERFVPDSKPCSRCGDDKPMDDFSVARDHADGRSAWCRDCIRDYGRERRQKAVSA